MFCARRIESRSVHSHPRPTRHRPTVFHMAQIRMMCSIRPQVLRRETLVRMPQQKKRPKLLAREKSTRRGTKSPSLATMEESLTPLTTCLPTPGPLSQSERLANRSMSSRFEPKTKLGRVVSAPRPFLVVLILVRQLRTRDRLEACHLNPPALETG